MAFHVVKNPNPSVKLSLGQISVLVRCFMDPSYPQHNDAMVRSSRVTSCSSKLSDRKVFIVAEPINEGKSE